ncbi:bacteriohemerythrin [Xanthomonas axonopodis]
MALLVWQDDLNTGIEVIDHQHRRIVDMINQLHAAHTSLQRLAVAEVIDELIDYTLSHFAFEEELMQEAGYPFSLAHARVHQVFGKRVGDYRLRFQAGEDVSDDLRNMLSRWLFNHIRGDDQAYAPQVIAHLNQFARTHQHGSWLGRTLKRIFR